MYIKYKYHSYVLFLLLQVNIKLDQIPDLTAFKNLPKLTFLPFVWFDTSMEMPKELTSQMWYLSNLTVILITIGKGNRNVFSNHQIALTGSFVMVCHTLEA